MFKISDVICAGLHVRINYARQSESVIFFRTSFAVILSTVALPIVLKAEFIFKLILYITIFVSLSPGSCFKSAICIQNLLERAPRSSCFRRS